MVKQVEPLSRDLTECEEEIRKCRREQDQYVAKKAEYENNTKDKAAIEEEKNCELLIILGFNIS
mgnify:FL=1